jgi:hypothetical protein
MNCPRCASPIEDPQALFCPVCGASVTAPPPAPAAAPPAADKGVGTAHCAIHPDKPAADICGRCGAFACSACLVISEDGTGICQACYEREGGAAVPFPWEQRQELGFFPAYWQTTKKVMFQPATAFDRMVATTGKWWDPISYSILSWYFAVSGTLVMYSLIFGAMGVAGMFGKGSGKSELSAAAGVGIGVGVFVAYLVAIPIFGTAFAFAAAGVEHLALKLVKVETRAFEATLRTYCFAQAPMFWGVVPYCGAYVHPIWHIVCRILGYKSVHKTTGGKAAAGVLIPVGVCGCTVGLMYLGLFAAGFMMSKH